MSPAASLGQGPGAIDQLLRPEAAQLARGGRGGTWTLHSLAAPRRARSLAATRGAHSHSLRARLRGAMDAALLLSLLEANCSLELAEELLLDGWGVPPDPEGRQEARELAAHGLAPRRSPSAGLRGTPRPGHLSEPLCAPSCLQVPTPTATRPWTRSGPAGHRAHPEL